MAMIFSEGRPSRNDMVIFVAHTDDPTDRLYVFFPDEMKVGVKTVKTYCLQMQRDETTRAILIVQQGMTPSAKQALTDLQPKYMIEQFQENELMVNITHHELVPTHTVMTNEEKKELLDR